MQGTRRELGYKNGPSISYRCRVWDSLPTSEVGSENNEDAAGWKPIPRASNQNGGIVRLPESLIQAAILHPEEEVRVAAVSYFSESYSQDAAIMPLIIRAAQEYPRDKAFRVLRRAERLPQSPATVDWLVEELRRSEAVDEWGDDNYRFAVALILYYAPAEILRERWDAIVALPLFPDPLRGPLAERLDVLGWDWHCAWAALETLAQDTIRKGRFTASDVRCADRIIESLARHRATRAEAVLQWFERPGEAGSEASIPWLQSLIMNLAGAMRLAAAVPIAVRHLADDHLSMADQSTTALIKIGTNAVVRAIADPWWNADANFRAAASDVLEHVHTDLCAESCLQFFLAEEDPETKTSLAHAVLSQFIAEGVEPVRQFVLGCAAEPPPHLLDLRRRLVLACTVMGVSFAECDAWREDAVANHWGLEDYQPPRLADGFQADQPGTNGTDDGGGISPDYS